MQRQMPYDLTYVWDVTEEKKKKKTPTQKEIRLVVPRGGVWGRVGTKV